MDIKLYNKKSKNQKGMALVISLVLLLALTIIGISILRGTRLNEKTVHNTQLKLIAFEAAESAINVGFNTDAVLQSQEDIPEESWNNPEPVKPDYLQEKLLNNLNLESPEGIITKVEADVSIQYCGESQLPKGTSLSVDESTLRWASVLFDVNGVAKIGNTHATSDHLQKGSLTRISTGREGNCTAHQ